MADKQFGVSHPKGGDSVVYASYFEIGENGDLVFRSGDEQAIRAYARNGWVEVWIN